MPGYFELRHYFFLDALVPWLMQLEILLGERKYAVFVHCGVRLCVITSNSLFVG